MDRQAIHKQMTVLLGELQELNRQLSGKTEKIPALELDLFRMKMISLYDQLNHLAIANRSQVVSKPEPKAEEKKALVEPDTETEEPETEAPVIEMPGVVEEQVSPIFIPEMPYEVDELGEPEEEQHEEEAIPEEGTAGKQKNEEKAGLKSDNGLSLHEKLSKAAQPADLVHSLKLQPLSDIRDGMSTSQRFQYIANLFGNDLELFNHSINYINTASSKSDAEDYLRINIEKKYKWNDEDPLVNDFKTLISRRFM